jgi:hypothetical protein
MMLKITLLIVLFLALAINALPIDSKDDPQVKSLQNNPNVVHYEYNQIPNLGYKFSYELSDGQTREEFGYFGENLELIVEGSYSYVVGGKTYSVNYFANKSGKLKKCLKN